MQKQKSLKINALLNLIKSLMGLLFPLITFPYSTRILGPEGIGKVNFANSIVSYFALLASLGVGTYATREAAKIKNNQYELNKFSKEILIINFTATFLSYFLFFISLILVPKFKTYKILLCICSSTILFNTLGVSWLYVAFEDYLYITIRTILFQIVSLVLLFTTVRTEKDIYQYAGLMVIASVGSNILNLINSKKYINPFIKSKIEIKKHLNPILILFATSLTVSLYTILDSSMLGFLSNDYQVGIYTASTKINKIVISLVTSITVVFLPRLSLYSTRQDKEDFNSLVIKGFKVILLFSIPCVFGLSLLSKNIILLLSGEKYLEAVLPMRLMNPTIVIIGLSGLIGTQIFIPLDKEKWTFYSVLVGAITNFTANILLIPKYGALGASISTLFAESMVTITQLILLTKIMNLTFLIKLFFKYLFNSLVMIIPILIINYFCSNIYLSLLFSILTGGIVYLALLLIQKDDILFSIINSIKVKFKK